MIYPAPSYLTGLVTEVNNQILLEIQKEYGDNTTAFKFNPIFTSLVQTWDEEYNHYGGTIFGIDKTNNRTVVFDQFKHGYNGVMAINEKEDLTSTKNIALIRGLK